MKVLSKESLQNIEGGWLDISWAAILEEFTGEDHNENGQIGIGCIIGC